MYLTRLSLNQSRAAILWAANPYRVHQRLRMACEGEPRLLFRLEDLENWTLILVQSQLEPDWSKAFDDFKVLSRPPEVKSFDLRLAAGGMYRFRLLANPAVKKTLAGDAPKPRKVRLGLIQEAEQMAWLERKLAAGAEMVSVQTRPLGLVQSRKNPAKDEQTQTHLGVLFEGVLRAKEPDKLAEAVRMGVGPAKGYGFGLLSLAAM